MTFDIYYSTNIKESYFCFKITNGVYAFPDFDPSGEIPYFERYEYLPRKMVIIQTIGPNNFICSCGITECAHISNCKQYIVPSEYVQELALDQNVIYKISKYIDAKGEIKPLPSCYRGLVAGVYSYIHGTFSIIRVKKKQFKCLTKVCKAPRCSHILAYKAKKNIQYVHVNASFPSVSKRTIRFPLSKEDGSTVLKCLSSQRSYPNKLIPKYDPTLQCVHGKTYSERATKATKKSYVHFRAFTLKVKVYHRLSTGICLCKQEYEGSEHVFFNLNNVHVFDVNWLLQIMSDIMNKNSPLAACIRSANSERIALQNFDLLSKKMYDNLRMAYNAFIRLLDVTTNINSIICLQCPESGPDTLQMDGTTIGCRQDKMDTNVVIHNNSEPIAECRIRHRVLFKEDIRRMLLCYVGKRGQEHSRRPMENREFQHLLMALPNSFSNLLEEAGNYCPDSFVTLLGELCTPYSTCGIFQFSGNDSRMARDILDDIATGDFTRLDTDIEQLHIYAPLLVEFVKNEDIPQYLISAVIKDILDSIDAPSRIPQPDLASRGQVPTPSQLPLHHFPNHLPYLGLANYGADRYKRTNEQRLLCNKITRRHQTLSPGLFTVFCPHGVCHGFTLMDRPESPRTAFEILVTKFKKIPTVIVYDDACHLQLYCVKREPALFKDTKFIIDNFHASGHTCTKGYHMVTYSRDKRINTLNSNLVEQANKQFRYLTSQIACMQSDNAIMHLAVFVAHHNLMINIEYLVQK